MASEESDRWKSVLKKADYTVEPKLVGIEAYKEIVNVWVEHKSQAK